MVFSRKLRGKLLDFFAGQVPVLWRLRRAAGRITGRELEAKGHDVRLIPPAYVKPFVKRQGG